MDRAGARTGAGRADAEGAPDRAVATISFAADLPARRRPAEPALAVAIGVALAVAAAGWGLLQVPADATDARPTRWTGPGGEPLRRELGWPGCGDERFRGAVIAGRLYLRCAAAPGFPGGAIGRIDPARGVGEVRWPLPPALGAAAAVVAVSAGPDGRVALVYAAGDGGRLVAGVLGERGWAVPPRVLAGGPYAGVDALGWRREVPELTLRAARDGATAVVRLGDERPALEGVSPGAGVPLAVVAATASDVTLDVGGERWRASVERRHAAPWPLFVRRDGGRWHRIARVRATGAPALVPAGGALHVVFDDGEHAAFDADGARLDPRSLSEQLGRQRWRGWLVMGGLPLALGVAAVVARLRRRRAAVAMIAGAACYAVAAALCLVRLRALLAW